MASNPKMEYQIFLAKLNCDSQQGRPCSLPSQRNYPISFKPKVAIAEFFWKNLVFHFEGGRHASFPQKPVVKSILGGSVYSFCQIFKGLRLFILPTFPGAIFISGSRSISYSRVHKRFWSR